jgi:hypothetical protein
MGIITQAIPNPAKPVALPIDMRAERQRRFIWLMPNRLSTNVVSRHRRRLTIIPAASENHWQRFDWAMPPVKKEPP